MGTASLGACSTEAGECNFRFARDSLRSNDGFKTGHGVRERKRGLSHPVGSTPRVGNPVRSELVHHHMAFSATDQRQAACWSNKSQQSSAAILLQRYDRSNARATYCKERHVSCGKDGTGLGHGDVFSSLSYQKAAERSLWLQVRSQPARPPISQH